MFWHVLAHLSCGDVLTEAMARHPEHAKLQEEGAWSGSPALDSRMDVDSLGLGRL